MKIFALALTLISAAASIAISVVLAPGAKVSTDLWFTSAGIADIAHAVLNVLISVIYFGIVGMALGILFRSPIPAISIGVLWILIIENLLGAVKPEFVKWMPGNLISTIALGGGIEISFMRAIILGTSFVFILFAIAATLFSKRDVAN
jgi:hypothetical protein